MAKIDALISSVTPKKKLGFLKWFLPIIFAVFVLTILTYRPLMDNYKYGGTNNALRTLQSAPDDAKAHRIAAIGLQSDGNYAAAASQYAALVKLEPQNQSALASYAICLERAGQKARAIQIYRQLSSLPGASGKIGRSGLRRLEDQTSAP